MSEWKKVKLGEMLHVRKGDYITKKEAKEGIYPVILGGKEPAYYIDKYNHTGKAIVISRSGASAGYVSFWNEPIFVTDGFLIEPQGDVIFEFLYYVLKCKQRELHNTQKGAAIPHVTPALIGDIEGLLPDVHTQQLIVDILSRYDSLIENYQKQIKLLEEAAQRLYKEWFVELRFPGHENTKMVDGLPEGWERKKLIEFGCSLESGARPKGGVDSNLKDGVPSVGAENVIGLGKYNYSSEKLVTNQFYSQMRKGKIKDRDILIYKDGAYIGRTSLFQDGFPHKELAVNEHVFLLHTLNENYQYYVFFTLYQKQYFEKMQKLNKNAAQPGLNQKALLDLVMLCPTENIVLSFNRAIELLMKALFSKANQIRLLTEARDRLLPRLMGGGKTL